ncbi:MAG: ABC transporter ATP-binding protein [Egibacteraceae bacterium]
MTADRLLAQAARRAPWWSVLFVLAMVVGAGSGLLLPAALAGAVDAALKGAGFGIALVSLGTLLVADTFASLVAGVAGARYSAVTSAWLRHRLLRHTLALGIPGQRRFAAGDVLSRLTGDAPGAGQVLPALAGVVVAVISALGAVVALWLIDWALAVAFLVGVLPIFVLVRVFMAQASGLFVGYQRAQAAIAARLLDAFTGIRTIRVSGTAEQEIDRILVPLGELDACGRALWHAQRQVGWQAGLLVPALEVVVLAVAGFGVAAGRVTPGQLLAAVGYVRIAVGMFEQIETLVGIVRARASATRVAEVLAVAPPSRPVLRALPAGPGALQLRGVTVRAGDTLTLDRLDLEVPAGCCVAVVGRCGAGKTTLALLVGGLLLPDEGEVLLDGVPVTALASEQLRTAVAYAFARPFLFDGTVHDAIAFAQPTLSRAQVEQAARVAAADGFIRRLPAGYDTPLTQAPLSGGEAQRLGLARAIAWDGRVMVFDDATSSLDTATEVTVSAALAGLLAGRTTIVVAHRAATAARADLVAWLEGGRLRRLGPHVRLWDDPEYRAVFAAEAPVPVRVQAGVRQEARA